MFISSQNLMTFLLSSLKNTNHLPKNSSCIEMAPKLFRKKFLTNLFGLFFQRNQIQKLWLHITTDQFAFAHIFNSLLFSHSLKSRFACLARNSLIYSYGLDYQLHVGQLNSFFLFLFEKRFDFLRFQLRIMRYIMVLRLLRSLFMIPIILDQKRDFVILDLLINSLYY